MNDALSCRYGHWAERRELADRARTRRSAPSLRERELQRLADDHIVALAAAEERVILTHDLDFSRIVALSRRERPSIISFRLHDMRSPNVISHLGEVIGRFSDDLERGALISVQEEAIRVRRLPVDE